MDGRGKKALGRFSINRCWSESWSLHQPGEAFAAWPESVWTVSSSATAMDCPKSLREAQMVMSMRMFNAVLAFAKSM